VEENGEQILYAVGSSGSSAFVLTFDGSTWEIITQDISAPSSITLHDGRLYIGGGFSSVAGVDIGGGVARWNPDTDTWSGIQGGTECAAGVDPDCSNTVGQVRTLHIHDGHLVMGGAFTYAGGERRNRIARINLDETNSQWEAMPGFDGTTTVGYYINDLASLETEEGSQLYAGGSFWLGEEGEQVNIVRWNGAQWEPLEEGVRRLVPNQDGYVNHIIPHMENGRAELFVGGYFQGAGPFASNNIARWFPDDRPPEVPVSVSPEHRSHDNSATLSFSWFSVDDAPLFDIQVDTDPAFSSVEFNGLDLTENSIDNVELAENELYYWRIRAKRDGFISRWSEPAYYTTGMVTSGEILSEHPLEFRLNQNYPNPFNPTTIISYQLPAASDVRLEIFDIIGRRVAVLLDGQVQAGVHQIDFNASHLASGLYLYRLTTADAVRTRKMMLVK